MRGLGIALIAVACVTVGCTKPDREPRVEPTDVIKELATNERTVNEFDVCAALLRARTRKELAKLVALERVAVDGRSVEHEDQLAQECAATAPANSDVGVVVSLRQGSEFIVAETSDPIVFPGCHVAPPTWDGARTTFGRASCRPSLVLDVVVTSADEARVDDSVLVELLRETLVAVADQA